MSSPAIKRNRKFQHPIKAATVLADLHAGVAPENSGSRITEPEPAEIARLAYSYWEARGRNGGNPEEDWLRDCDQNAPAEAVPNSPHPVPGPMVRAAGDGGEP